MMSEGVGGSVLFLTSACIRVQSMALRTRPLTRVIEIRKKKMEKEWGRDHRQSENGVPENPVYFMAKQNCYVTVNCSFFHAPLFLFRRVHAVPSPALPPLPVAGVPSPMFFGVRREYSLPDWSATGTTHQGVRNSSAGSDQAGKLVTGTNRFLSGSH